MKFLSRVVWSEGMHLGPHHFQAQSRYFEDTLWFLNSHLRPDPWGFIHYSLDSEAVKAGRAVLEFASGIMPDGLIFDTPDCDAIPPPVDLNTLFSPVDSETVLHLSIPRRQDQGLDCDLVGSGEVTRYGKSTRVFRDDTTGQGEIEVSIGRKNLAVWGASQIPEGTVSFPIARVVRDGRGGFAYDPRFIPPCLRIGASETLVLLLHRLIQSIQERIDSTRAARRSSGGFELGTSALDVTNYWFLHALSSAAPVLMQHLEDKRSHPEALYRDLAQLAGALSTFSLESNRDQIPPYSHRNLEATFEGLDALIRRYLEVVTPTNTVSLEFRQAGRYIFEADLSDERCLRRARWIFGVRSSLAESALLRQTPLLTKICSARGIQTLVQRALPGLELMHLSVPPSALHAKADMHYFSISQTGPCWQHILESKRVGVYLPGDLGDATFELTIILEAQP
jgi:type VI secretion system protein ImpJ